MKLEWKKIIPWCLYDWACTPFSAVIITFIFSTYYITKVAINPIVGTYQWSNAIAIAGMVIAILSPLIGAIADYGGYHRRWLTLFTWLCIIPTALLWFAYPNPQSTMLVLSCLILATIGLEISQVFYNAFLTKIAPFAYIGRISGLGFGCGYIGGIIALIIALFVFVKGNHPWLDKSTVEQVRICGPFIALWYALFSLPFCLTAPTLQENPLPIKRAISLGTQELWRTIKLLPKEKNIFLYLFAHMIYTDGLNSLLAFGGLFAAGTFGMSLEEVLIFGIAMNFSAGIGAVVMGWVDDWFGSKLTIIISLITFIVVGMTILMVYSKFWFFCLSLIVGLFVGPLQSASRSLMIDLMANKKMSTEMFGLYALSGKITAFLSPWLFGFFTLYFQSQRAGFASIFLFFLLGGLFLAPVKVAKQSRSLAV